MGVVICLELDREYRGAKVHAVVYTSSEEVCRELRDVMSRGITSVIDWIMEFLRKHGGCHVVSEIPLVVETGDGSISVRVEPLNFIARAFLNLAVEKAKEICR